MVNLSSVLSSVIFIVLEHFLTHFAALGDGLIRLMGRATLGTKFYSVRQRTKSKIKFTMLTFRTLILEKKKNCVVYVLLNKYLKHLLSETHDHRNCMVSYFRNFSYPKNLN
jgi:hypothetical protein